MILEIPDDISLMDLLVLAMENGYELHAGTNGTFEFRPIDGEQDDERFKVGGTI